MKERKLKRFGLADEKTKILKPHICETFFMKHLNAKKTDSQYSAKSIFQKTKNVQNVLENLFDQKKTEIVKNRYELKCLNCPSKMMLKDFDSHLKEGCKKECSKKLPTLFY